jgi:dolichol-phosphate mannosyltransferase
MVTNKEKNFISAVVYVHNNEKVISGFIQNIAALLESNFEKYEIICVNDHSTDDSIKEIKNIAIDLSGAVSIINLSFYQGIELAMNAGIDMAIGDFVYEFDSVIIDYPIETIINIYNRSLEGYDIVSVGPNIIKKASSRIFYAVYNKFSKTNYKIQTESFRILSRRAINRVHSMSKTIPYRKAFYANCGLKTDLIQYDNQITTKRVHAQLLQESRRDTAINSIILFTDAAYKFAITLTFIMMTITFASAIYTIAIFLGKVRPVEGWTTTMLLLSFAFFGVFAILSIIIKYLSIILNLIFKKQKYTIESFERINK